MCIRDSYRLGLTLALDNIWSRNPYIVPYIGGGAYMIKYSEKDPGLGVSVDDTTSMSFYFKGGLMLQLDWIDSSSGFESFYESGIQNTFLFIEATKYTESDKAGEPNLGAMIISAGLKLEF